MGDHADSGAGVARSACRRCAPRASSRSSAASSIPCESPSKQPGPLVRGQARQAGKASFAFAIASSTSSTPARGQLGQHLLGRRLQHLRCLSAHAHGSPLDNVLAASATGGLVVQDGPRSIPIRKDAADVTHGAVGSSQTRLFPPELDHAYPVAVRGEGAGPKTSTEPLSRCDERRLDGGDTRVRRADLVAAAREQGCPPRLRPQRAPDQSRAGAAARDLVEVAPEGFTRAHFVTGGAEANEAALRLARHYHVNRGEPERWRVISPAQSYHGPTIATLALTAARAPGPAHPVLHAGVPPHPTDHRALRPDRGGHTRGSRPRPRGSRALKPSRPSSVSRSAAPRFPPTSLRTASGRAWLSGVSATGS